MFINMIKIVQRLGFLWNQIMALLLFQGSSEECTCQHQALGYMGDPQTCLISCVRADTSAHPSQLCSYSSTKNRLLSPLYTFLSPGYNSRWESSHSLDNFLSFWWPSKGLFGFPSDIYWKTDVICSLPDKYSIWVRLAVGRLGPSVGKNPLPLITTKLLKLPLYFTLPNSPELNLLACKNLDSNHSFFRVLKFFAGMHVDHSISS